MGLFAPWFLAGLAAIGLPIWLHLLQQHKVDPVRFPSLQLFERRTETSVRQRRLKYRLLFALRALMLALLALLFAQPFIRREPRAAGAAELNLIVVDRSFSMRAGGALKRAKQEAAALAGRLGAGQLVEVVALSGRAELLTQPTADKAEVQSAIAAIREGDGQNQFAEVARVVKMVSETRKIPLHVHLFSDLQKASLPAAFAELALPAGTRLTLHPVPATAANYFVESVNAPAVIADPKKARVTATLAGHGAGTAQKTVTLKLNGKTAGSQTVTIPENGRVTVEFLGWDAPYGWTRGEVEIDGGDPLAGDDRFRFAMERADPRRVLFIHEASRARSAVYFRAALEASAEGLFILEPRTVQEAAGADPAAYALVVLSDVAGLPAALEEQLRRYVQSGGGLWVAAAGLTATQGRVPVWGAKITETRYASRGNERFFSPAQLDLAHPALARANKLEGVKVLQAVRVDGAGGAIAARLSDGTPLLIDTKLGEGRILTFTSGFDNLSNDLPLHASFVPFVEQAARYLAQLETRPATVTVDSFIELRDAASEGRSAAEIINPQGERVLSLKDAATAQSYQLDAAGYWEIVRPNSRRELVAVNPHRAESDLTPAPPDVLDLWTKTGDAAPAADGAASPENRQPVNLWWYVALLLLIASLIESFIASRHLEPGAAGS